MAFDTPTDWIIIIVLVLVLFGGAKKIPELARSLGRAHGEYTRGKMELERELKNSYEAQPVVTSQYRDAAKSLGIDPGNKTDEELKQEIARKVSTNQ
ncbi:MAG: twin-arginine translocase TatA/TatE family subunit [Candidatus Thermoplasmatota archaeon]|jgi:sec-independent protein translocase protein TatA|nr:twin-arginine translocase TatA/TatE family subunit [Candidatus Thermoplasmatota archaeon]MCL5786187.1 twin-arginine translocase TatA/TatE family subunit [Candidatus Thermoplasmatota archaeon]